MFYTFITGDGPTAVSSSINYFLSDQLHVESWNSYSNVKDIKATVVSETTHLMQFFDIESTDVSNEDSEDTDASPFSVTSPQHIYYFLRKKLHSYVTIEKQSSAPTLLLRHRKEKNWDFYKTS